MTTSANTKIAVALLRVVVIDAQFILTTIDKVSRDQEIDLMIDRMIEVVTGQAKGWKVGKAID